MSRIIVTCGLFLACLMFVTATAVMSDQALDGGSLVHERCTQCHNLDRVERRAGQDLAWWERTVGRMIGKRSDLLDASERAAVLEYLSSK